MNFLLEILFGTFGFVLIVAIVLGAGYAVWKVGGNSLGHLLRRHLVRSRNIGIDISSREFPLMVRVDICNAIEQLVQQSTLVRFVGLKPVDGFGRISIANFLTQGFFQSGAGDSCPMPPQYEYIDVGESEPDRVLVNGMWLIEREGIRLALLFAPACEWGACGATRKAIVEVAVLGDERGVALAAELFRYLEQEVQAAKSYRGKVLSFENEDSYDGQGQGVKVHRLAKVDRDNVILPSTTVDLLERNLIAFTDRRNELRALGMATKKGLLFYGPPGTGKTHTIRYLAGALPDHTTLLITAEQVALLGEYMTLARLLQPSLVVLEDVDLIARSRADMNDPRAELLLNKLLNEMDGLRENTDVIFILTTNRPEELEHALAARPGRIDQAIEFPLPDADGRRKLVRLYGRELAISPELLQRIVERTEHVTASFIKELMRRAAQFHLERKGDNSLRTDDVDLALNEMLFTGGALNMKLLGAGNRVDGEIAQRAS